MLRKIQSELQKNTYRLNYALVIKFGSNKKDRHVFLV